ncbi:hypothetical protein [Streptomyces sp. NPDC048442]
MTVSGKGTAGQQDRLLWQSVWPETGREGHPPVALVFTKPHGR